MKKYIILSVNDNPKYLFWVPLTVALWSWLGWWPVVFYFGKWDKISNFAFNELDGFAYELSKIQDYQPETITQCSRLYGACVANGYLMTGDIDMIPLSDYWKPDENKLTVYGRDLTDYHYPICYIGMDCEKWKEVMNIDGNDYQYYMQRDLRKQANMWILDQDIITEKINASHFVPERIDRGTGKNGYPIGRVDRSAWTLKHNVFIDAHLPHDVLTNDISFKNVMELLYFNWPAEDWRWWILYYKEFKKLCQK